MERERPGRNKNPQTQGNGQMSCSNEARASAEIMCKSLYNGRDVTQST